MEITLTEEMLDRAIEAHGKPDYDCLKNCLLCQHPNIVHCGMAHVVIGDTMQSYWMPREGESVVELFTSGQYDEIRKQLPLTITLTED